MVGSTLINNRCREVRERLRDAMNHMETADLISPEVGVFSEMVRQLNSMEWMTLEQLATALKFFEGRNVDGLTAYLADIKAEQKTRRRDLRVPMMDKQEEVTTAILDAVGSYLDITGLGRHGIDEPTGLLMEQRAIKKFENEEETRQLLDQIEQAVRQTQGRLPGAQDEDDDEEDRPPFKLEYDLQVFEDETHRPFGVLVAEFTWENNEKLSLPYESFVRVSTVQHIELPTEPDINDYDKKLISERRAEEAKAKARSKASGKDLDDDEFPEELLERMRAKSGRG